MRVITRSCPLRSNVPPDLKVWEPWKRARAHSSISNERIGIQNK